jgi:hypothetical protein
MTYLTDVNLHLELAMATQEMVEIREDSEESLEMKDDNNWDNESNIYICQDANCLIILNGGR